MQESKQISRKDFLKGVGRTVAGVAVAGSVGSILTGCSTAAPTASVTERPEWPFKYQKSDPDKAAERAYKGYKEKGG